MFNITARSCLLSLLVLATPAPATGQAPKGPVLGPRLLYYPVRCLEGEPCRITCYLNGQQVLDKGSIATNDEINLVMNAGTRDELSRQWLEIKSRDGRKVQTLLLTADTFCNLQNLSIDPLRVKS